MDCQILCFFKKYFITCNFSMIEISWNLMMFQNSFCMFKALKTLLWKKIIWVIYLFIYSYIKCAPLIFKIESSVHHFFSKLKRIFTLMILKITWLKIGEIHFKNPFWFFSFKCVFGPKIMKFENVSLTKVFIFMWQKTWIHNTHDILRSKCNKSYLYLTHNCKIGLNFFIFEICNKHLDSTCHM